LRAAPVGQRTRLLAEARQPGTLPPDIHTAITARLAAGALAWRCGRPERLTNSGVRLADGRHLEAGRVILATGFDPRPAPASLLGRTLEAFDLSGDRAGHLYLDAALAAAPGLYITGRPASLQLGPMAGNIKGARMAGQILANVARRAVPMAIAS
jgi:hypothetical protein